VNIKHVTDEVAEILKGRDPLDVIFQKQLGLMEKYHSIESRSGLVQTEDVPVDLHDAKGQARLKDFAWRVTEELAEAFECYYDEEPDFIHVVEEIADALHFLVELTILSGLGPRDLILDPSEGLVEDTNGLKALCVGGVTNDPLLLSTGPLIDVIRVRLCAWSTVEALGQAMNCLKNKPWKQTQMMTDIPKFQAILRNVWGRFLLTCVQAGVNMDLLALAYLKKETVNRFRQGSNY
jgi:hypothetical protein